ncbi:leucyl aminopeptidase [Rarobacter incanus]|uniref:Probable cytosol aminopeptidase n=1 Tax=Rarobacter incanus TaxID=153494 RepID=A0A542SNL2_9MICO|nr:leucyl aminopeptidase [Rarobacter incanus]TQK75847.1 leucyl aminopeptidase [Rarobacter incanus]
MTEFTALPLFSFVDEFPASDSPVIRVAAVSGGGAEPSTTVLGPLSAQVPAGTDFALLGIKPAAGAVSTLALGPGASPLVLAGIGADATVTSLRDAAASAARALVTRSADLHFAFPIGDRDQAVAVGLGAVLGAYTYDRYRSKSAGDAAQAVIRVLLPADLAGVADELTQRVLVVAEQVYRTRDLVNEAPNDLSPQAFADYAVKAAKAARVKTTVFDSKALADGGFGGLVAVGQGSVRPPRLVKVAYRPARAKQHIALVGKGITFDSGGLSLKPAKSMETMKSDMAGAATVLGAVLAAAQLKLPVAVTGWLCLAENLPSGSATRPSDVITMRNGKTVEVLNTDAEGRLVLADGLSAAVAEKPDAVIDIATLTGAQLVALGPDIAAVMGTDETRSAVLAAAREADESMWPMPLPEDLKDGLESQVADLKNIGDRFGGMLVAGLFLKEFVDDVPWAHLDVAGPAYNERGARGINAPGGTGFGLLTLLRVIENRALGR